MSKGKRKSRSRLLSKNKKDREHYRDLFSNGFLSFTEGWTLDDGSGDEDFGLIPGVAYNWKKKKRKRKYGLYC